MTARKVVHLVAAARPNFMKIAPLFHRLRREDWCDPKIVHTGQHYDANMSDAFFTDLMLPEADFHLGVGSGSHAQQTGGVMVQYEAVASAQRPDCIVVVGDVNSTVACALVGTKLWIPVVHLEAGLRSRDRRMPEEINRLATDAIADYLWTPSPDADENLLAEGVPAARIEQVGNIMLDSYELLRGRIEADDTRQRLVAHGGGYGVVTLHRPSNVDTREMLGAIVERLLALSATLPLVFPVHPRTRAKLVEFGLFERLTGNGRITETQPLGYVQFMNLVGGARLILTDSGGVQEETTYLGIPCLTLRDSTERPITLSQGTNRLVTLDSIDAQVKEIMAGHWQRLGPPANWDGHVAERCSRSLRRWLAA